MWHFVASPHYRARVMDLWIHVCGTLWLVHTTGAAAKVCEDLFSVSLRFLHTCSLWMYQKYNQKCMVSTDVWGGLILAKLRTSDKLNFSAV